MKGDLGNNELHLHRSFLGGLVEIFPQVWMMMGGAWTLEENTYVEECGGCFTHNDDKPADDAS